MKQLTIENVDNKEEDSLIYGENFNFPETVFKNWTTA